MMKILTVLALLTAVLISGCEVSDSGMNKSCTSNCFMLNGIENDSAAEVDAKIKKICEDMGRKGTPEIKERTKTAVAGYCPE
jgi:hypothetical protein